MKIAKFRHTVYQTFTIVCIEYIVLLNGGENLYFNFVIY